LNMVPVAVIMYAPVSHSILNYTNVVGRMTIIQLLNMVDADKFVFFQDFNMRKY